MKISIGKIILSILKTMSPKNIGSLYRFKLFLDKNLLLTLYYLHIHTFLNYPDFSQGSTNRKNLKKPFNQQKHAVGIISNRIRFDHTKKLFKLQKMLNIYKLNILSVAAFIYQIRNETALLTFSGSFEKISYEYPINFLTISCRWPFIWSNFFQNFET